MAPGSKTACLAQVHRDLGQPTLTVTIRPGVRIISTRGFSRDVESAPDPAEVQRWTFFNKKIEALKHQAADGSAPATLVKETTSGRNRGPEPKKTGSDDEPAAPIVASQEYQPQQVLTGKLIPMNEVVQTVAALPSSMDANGEV
ncbi:hypothetical protein ACKLNR_007476 [Fusarium oxysporum f. sp. zingiberi]